MVQTIPLSTLALMLLPVLIVFAIQYLWGMPKKYDSLYATLRMVIQLLLVAYILKAIFDGEQAWVTLLVLLVMLIAATWISIRPIKNKNKYFYLIAFVAILTGGFINLCFMFIVLSPDPWFSPSIWIPLAGMVFSAAMNSVSLAAERFEHARDTNEEYLTARNEAYNASLIPQINGTLAVGLVALPGMMTGQILSGVDPLIAVRYQIMIMCMALSVAGISAAIYLQLIKRFSYKKTNEKIIN